MTEEIRLVQYPIIEHKLKEIGANVDARLSALEIENQVATEATVKTLKELRTELNKELEVFEYQRKDIKKAILNPYDEFENIYKSEISTKYNNAISSLKDKIAFVETAIKNQKKETLQKYFDELIESEQIDFVTFAHLGFDINLSTTEKAYKEKINEFVSRVKQEIQLIEASEFPIDSMVEYRRTLNVSSAITNVKQRKEAEKAEIERQKQAKKAERIRKIQGIGAAWNEFAQAFEHSKTDLVISKTDVENLPDDEFLTKFIELETAIKSTLAEEKPVIMQASKVAAPTTIPTSTPAPKPEILTASFEVSGTLEQLMKLKSFLIENNINYKNI